MLSRARRSWGTTSEDRSRNPRGMDVKDSQLHDAARDGNLEEVSRIVEGGPLKFLGLREKFDVNQLNEAHLTALHEAAFNGHAEVISFLIGEGADLNVCAEHDGYTALHYAAEGGHVESLHALLKAGADRSICSAAGSTPLELAVREGHLEAMQLLMHLGLGGGGGGRLVEQGPLMQIAVAQGHAHCFSALIALAGGFESPNLVAEVNERNLLHEAASMGHKDLVLLTLAAGADQYKVNQDGQTAGELAVQNGNSDCVEVLIGSLLGNSPPVTIPGKGPLQSDIIGSSPPDVCTMPCSSRPMHLEDDCFSPRTPPAREDAKTPFSSGCDAAEASGQHSKEGQQENRSGQTEAGSESKPEPEPEDPREEAPAEPQHGPRHQLLKMRATREEDHKAFLEWNAIEGAERYQLETWRSDAAPGGSLSPGLPLSSGPSGPGAWEVLTSNLTSACCRKKNLPEGSGIWFRVSAFLPELRGWSEPGEALRVVWTPLPPQAASNPPPASAKPPRAPAFNREDSARSPETPFHTPPPGPTPRSSTAEMEDSAGAGGGGHPGKASKRFSKWFYSHLHEDGDKKRKEGDRSRSTSPALHSAEKPHKKGAWSWLKSGLHSMHQHSHQNPAHRQVPPEEDRAPEEGDASSGSTAPPHGEYYYTAGPGFSTERGPETEPSPSASPESSPPPRAGPEEAPDKGSPERQQQGESSGGDGMFNPRWWYGDKGWAEWNWSWGMYSQGMWGGASSAPTEEPAGERSRSHSQPNAPHKQRQEEDRYEDSRPRAQSAPQNRSYYSQSGAYKAAAAAARGDGSGGSSSRGHKRGHKGEQSKPEHGERRERRGSFGEQSKPEHGERRERRGSFGGTGSSERAKGKRGGGSERGSGSGSSSSSSSARSGIMQEALTDVRRHIQQIKLSHASSTDRQRSALRALQAKYHPDKNPVLQWLFEEISKEINAEVARL